VAQPVAASPSPSPAPANTDPWRKTAVHLRGHVGMSSMYQCPPGGAATGAVWGTDVYTDDSAVCAAAVHAGLITPGGGGSVTVFVQPGRGGYTGSARNGVTSNNYAAFPGSFAFVAHPPAPPSIPGAQTFAWSESAVALRGSRTTVRVFCPPGGPASASVWGSGPTYTDDSAVCVAAVHAGLATVAAGGTFTLRPVPGAARYGGSTRHGVTTHPYGSFPGGYRLER
jgi:hypothetical protein